MGRKSTAEKFLEEYREYEDSHDRTYIVLYDFTGGPPNSKFYTNLQRISRLTQSKSSLIQYSCYKTKSAKAALAVQALAAREGAETVIYHVQEISQDQLKQELNLKKEDNRDS